jgi:hypothetical protein
MLDAKYSVVQMLLALGSFSSTFNMDDEHVETM